MSESKFAECGGCYTPVDAYDADTITVTHNFVPLSQTHYHSGCHDPWPEGVGYGAW